MLALPLPRGPRVRLAQGLWLVSWLLVLAGSLTVLCTAHLLAQLRALGAFLAPNCHFPALPRAALLAGATALGTGLGGAGASCASLDAMQYPIWSAALGPLLLGGALGGGGLLVIAVGLALVLPVGLDAGLQEGLGGHPDPLQRHGGARALPR